MTTMAEQIIAWTEEVFHESDGAAATRLLDQGFLSLVSEHSADGKPIYAVTRKGAIHFITFSLQAIELEATGRDLTDKECLAAVDTIRRGFSVFFPPLLEQQGNVTLPSGESKEASA